MKRELNNRRILSLALEALKVEREKIDEEILSIQERLGENPRRTRAANTNNRRISPAGLKNIAAAQKKRWATHRASKARTKATKS